MLETIIMSYSNSIIKKRLLFTFTDKKFSFLNADELEKMKEEEGNNRIKNEK